MTIRKLSFWVLGIGAAAAVVLFIWSLFGSYTVTMTQQELQDKIDAKMPYTTAKHNITVQKANVDLSGDKLGVGVEASTTKWKADLTAKASTTGTLTYDKEKHAFYFAPDAIKLGEVTVEGKKVPNALINVTQKGLDGKLLEAAQAALRRIPVYTLPDNFKSNVAKLVVEKVEVKNGTITAELRFYRLTYALLGYFIGFAICVGLIILLLCCPELGNAVFSLFAIFGGGSSHT